MEEEEISEVKAEKISTKIETTIMITNNYEENER